MMTPSPVIQKLMREMIFQPWSNTQMGNHYQHPKIARGKLCDRDAIVRALENGTLAGYAGDVWPLKIIHGVACLIMA